MSKKTWGILVVIPFSLLSTLLVVPDDAKPFVTIFLFIWLICASIGWIRAGETTEARKTPRRILAGIVDSGVRKSYQNAVLISQTGQERIEALIRASDDLTTERDTVWVCKQLAKSRTDPFELYELKYGKGAFKGKRLKFLQDARVHARIRNDDDAINYLHSTWADENGLKETTGEPRVRFAIIQALNKWSGRFR